MTQLSRRSFLLACTASAVALALPSAAVAAPAKTIVLEGVRDAAGKYNVRVPADIASSLGKLRTAELTIASNRALRIAQNQNLARPKANGLLTRLWSPSLRAAPKGIVPTLVQAGLILGFAWALSNATGDLNKDATSTMTAGGAACEVYPALPSTVWARSTGIYRNSTGSQALAVQSTRATGGTGTLPAPAGWNNGGQRNAVALGGGSYEWEVQFTKNVACGERVAFPPTVPSGAVPGAEHAGTQVDTHSETNVGKIADAQHQKAVDDIKAGVPLPGGVIPGEVEDTDGGPITSVPVAQLDLGGLAFDWGQQVGDYVTPRAQIGNEDTHVKFPPEVPLPGAETPSPTPTPPEN
jgi:hypothetical protein